MRIWRFSGLLSMSSLVALLMQSWPSVHTLGFCENCISVLAFSVHGVVCLVLNASVNKLCSFLGMSVAELCTLIGLNFLQSKTQNCSTSSQQSAMLHRSTYRHISSITLQWQKQAKQSSRQPRGFHSHKGQAAEHSACPH